MFAAKWLAACEGCRRRATPKAVSKASSKAAARAEEPTPESIAVAKERVAAAEDHRQRGTGHFKKKEFGRAVASYTEALRSNPDEPSVWANRSIAHRQLSLWAEAAEDGDRAVALDPSNVKAHYSKALALQKLGRDVDALAACSAGLAECGDHGPLTELQVELLASDSAAETPKKTKKAPEDKPKAPPKKEAPPAAPSPAPKKKADYSVNYSKWKDIADSDDERELQQSNVSQDLMELGEGEDVEIPMHRRLSDEERMYIVDQLMVVTRANLGKNRKTLAGGLEGSGLPGCGGSNVATPSKAVRLPPDHMRSMGVIGLPQLAGFSCSSPRMLVSVYGDIFDVSSQPELYGFGKHSFHSGADVTWGLITGDLTPKTVNRFYDIFKMDKEVDLRRNLMLVCHYLVSYREDFGQPVGRLDNWINESALPMPPLSDSSSCPQQ